MKPFRDTAKTQPETPILFAAGNPSTPGRLGVQRVYAYAVALLGLGALAGSIAAALELREPLVILAGLAVAVGCAIYAVSVWGDVQQVRRSLWAREEATGQDLDGDGHIGPPAQPAPAGHVVRIGGRAPAAVVLPDLDPGPDRRPLVKFPQTPPVTANDVIYILTHAAADGLIHRAWEGRLLPSGAKIDRPLWTGILDGMLAWQFANASMTANNRRIVTLRTDVDIEAMIHAVQQGVGAA